MAKKDLRSQIISRDPTTEFMSRSVSCCCLGKMQPRTTNFFVLLAVLLPALARAFSTTFTAHSRWMSSSKKRSTADSQASFAGVCVKAAAQVELDFSDVNEEKVSNLFAWVTRAFAGDPSYNNLILALIAIFNTNLDENAEPMKMLEKATASLPVEEELVGEPFSRRVREQHSLGAMGAGQWTGQFRTRPHALLNIQNVTSVEEWVKSLPRGARRTLARATKAAEQNFTVSAKPIYGGKPAPHSSLA